MFMQIENLSFRYPRSKEPTIQNFTLDVAQGEIVSILGESGSGKSTILRLIAGLEVPSSGRILINGQVIVDDTHFVQPEKRGMGMVFQDYALFPHMTVAENIQFGLKRLSKSQKRARVKELLQLIHMLDFATRYPYELSGGQQQRVALARALAPRPSLLMMDEPFSNLDAHLQNSIREELQQIIKQTGITCLFVTHDQEDSRALSDRTIVLKNGFIDKIGHPNEILGKQKAEVHS